MKLAALLGPILEASGIICESDQLNLAAFAVEFDPSKLAALALESEPFQLAVFNC